MNSASSSENTTTALRAALSALREDPASDAKLAAVLGAACALVAALPSPSEHAHWCLDLVRSRAARVRKWKSEAKRMPEISALSDAANQLIQASKGAT